MRVAAGGSGNLITVGAKLNGQEREMHYRAAFAPLASVP